MTRIRTPRTHKKRSARVVRLRQERNLDLYPVIVGSDDESAGQWMPWRMLTL